MQKLKNLQKNLGDEIQFTAISDGKQNLKSAPCVAQV